VRLPAQGAAVALLAVSFIASAQPKPASPPPPGKPQAASRGAEMLLTNQYLTSGGYLVSQDKQLMGIVQNDGRFCVYKGNSIAHPGPIMGCAPAKPQPYAVYNLWMRSDGTLCISLGPAPVASTEKPAGCLPGPQRPEGEYFAVLANNGALELYPGRERGPQPAYATVKMETPPTIAAAAPVLVPVAPVQPSVVPTVQVMVTLTLTPIQLGSGAATPVSGSQETPKPLLMAYVLQPDGKPDRRYANAVCPSQCSLKVPVNSTVEIAAPLPVKEWTGLCKTVNASKDPGHTCVVSLKNDTSVGLTPSP